MTEFTMTDEVCEQIASAFRKHHEELLDGDGWALLNPEYYTNRGMPEAWVNTLVYMHHSGGGKYDIFDNDGNRVESMEAIHNLDFLSAACRVFGLETEAFSGRGFQARACCTAVRKHLSLEAAV